MKLRALVICAVTGLLAPAAAQADLIVPPDASTPASDPPPADPGGASEKPATEPAAGPTGDAPTDPTSSLQGPPKAGCASCRVGDPSSEGALPLVIAAIAAAIAVKRRRDRQPIARHPAST